MFKFKVVPKQIIDFDGFTQTIDKIRGRALLPLTLQKSEIEVEFYFEFLRTDGTIRGSKNASQKDIFDAFLKSTAADPAAPTETEIQNAKDQADTIIKNLIAGTETARYSAAATLAGSYGYELLPQKLQTND
jgi:hypothetical protein